MLLWLLIPAAVVGAGVVYQFLGALRDERRLPAPGHLVSISSTRLHVNTSGAGEPPTVVFEAGIAATSLSWARVEPLVAEFAPVATYDRAGLGYSSLSRAPRCLSGMIAELDGVLSNAGLAGPYVLVGHSFGGLLIRAYAHAHPAKVAGLVFVDPVSLAFWADASPQSLRRLQRGIALSRRGALLARFGIVRLGLSALSKGSRRFPQLIAKLSAGRGTSTLQNLTGEVRKLPSGLWPIVAAHWSRPKSFTAMAAYLECLPAAARETRAMPLPPGIPFTILSAASATPAELAERDAWVQASLAASTLGRHVCVPASGHWLHLEHPQLVAEAIHSLLASTSSIHSYGQLAFPRPIL